MKKLIILFFVTLNLFAQRIHPNLILTNDDVKIIRENWEKFPLFKKTFEDAKKRIDEALPHEIDVPIPKDAAAYTHEKHKQNYTEMQLAGFLYQITQEKKYAEFVKLMLIKYAKLYPTLKQHPAAASNSPGRLFWQSLNETVWLVNTIQAYDCIYDYLTADERKNFEENIFRKMTDFLIKERVHEFDLIHNHGTWMAAAVGMTGFVLGDNDLVQKALYGSKKTGEFGFLKQLQILFSPDGYYTEGAYYVRYALAPFFLFAEAINNNLPQLKIYDYKNQILKKGFYCAIEMTYTNGAFIPFNDAIKEKNYLSPELITSLNLTLKHYGLDESILGIAKKQNAVMLNGAGIYVAEEIAKRKDLPNYNYRSVEFSDGANGDEGGLAFIRSGEFENQSLLFMKYTGHGLSHGHYDKLSFCYYNNGNEIIQDYGSARFINIEQKFGGRYLPENKSWAMSTIAHNTVTVDEKSQFNGDIKISEKYHSNKHFFEVNDTMQIVSAYDDKAYEDVKMLRTMAMIKDKNFQEPVIIDIFRVNSDKEHQYDYPIYYRGNFISTNIECNVFDKERKPLGNKNGYQHLWKESEGFVKDIFQFTWLNQNRFYTITTNSDSSKIFFTRIGASDPNFNLRNDAGFILRKKSSSHVFASAIEPHGIYDGVREFTAGSFPKIRYIKVIETNDEFTLINIKASEKINWLLFVSNDKNKFSHSVTYNNKKFDWNGNYLLIKN